VVAVSLARLQLGYTRITAPIAGRLGLRQADRGNVVNPSDTNGIVTITQVKPIDAVFSVPEAHVGTLAQRLANGRDMPVELWDRELKRQLASGKLNALDNSIDIATGTVKAKAAFDNAQGRLFANQFVNVKLEVDRLEQALTVPATAVQNNYVYLVQGDGTVTQRRITVGVADGDRVSVKGELQPGDQVVVDGIDRLREGAKVTVIEADKVQKVDQAVQDASSQPRGMRNLPPDVRAKLATMNPDERKAYLQKLRAERAGQRNGGAPGGEGGAPAGQPPAGQSPAPSPGSPQPSPGPAVSPAPAATAPAGR
jgi:multidrug efflux system membrane fusion protein